MKTDNSNQSIPFDAPFHFLQIACLAGAFALLSSGCGHNAVPPPQTETPARRTVTAKTINSLALILAPHSGETSVDLEIRRFQEQVRSGQNASAALERLGWAFVAKARESFDPGYYKLAEACAAELEKSSPDCAESLLLRGHVLESLHRFKEAEAIARRLVTNRGLSFDYALLGDSLMEQGRLDEAVAAYQSMIDLRPDLESYSRAAHVRWLKGDLDGAMEMMRAAASASSSRDPESAAWVHCRLAGFQLQSGATDEARQACAAALALRPDYPPALLLRGKMLMAEGDAAAAVKSLETATRQNPLPEYQWALAESLRAAGREDQAAAVEADLRAKGAATDPRTFSLYLATRGEDTETAVRLAEEELQQRQDVFTEDALAWALAAAGRVDEARVHIAHALAQGTQDARLFFHAAVIANLVRQTDEAQERVAQANTLPNTLLPSEQQQLNKVAEEIAAADPESDFPMPPSMTTAFSVSGQ